MGKDGGWRLPETINPARQCIRLDIPKDQNHAAAFIGALQELTKWWNWERDGSHQAIQAALVWQDILSQLVGQVDYSLPEIDALCEGLVNIRLTESCVLQFTNDGGETWQDVENWSELEACFIGPQGPQGVQGEQGEQGEQGPQGVQGETGVVAVDVNVVDGDTLPDLTYNAGTQTLEATLQAQWFRGIRVTPADVPEGLSGHQIEIQTYDSQPDWAFLGWIPPYVKPTEFTDAPDPSFTDEEIACGMATALMLALQGTWEQELETIDTTASAIEAIGELVEIFYVTGIAIALQGAFDFAQIIYNQTRAVLESSFTPTQYDEMQQELYCLLLAAGSYDGSVLIQWRDWANNTYNLLDHPGAWSFANQLTFMELDYFKRKALVGALDPLTTCQFYTCDDWIDNEGGAFPIVYTVRLDQATAPAGLDVISGAWVANEGVKIEGTGPKTLEFELELSDRLASVSAIRFYYLRQVTGGGNWTREIDVLGVSNDFNQLITNFQPVLNTEVYQEIATSPNPTGAKRVHVRVVSPSGGPFYNFKVTRIALLIPVT